MRKLLISFSILLMSIQPIYAKDVYIGGDSIGIVANYNGLLITGTYAFEDKNTTYNNNKTIQSNDLLIMVNDTEINNLKQFNEVLNTIQNSMFISIVLIRNDKKIYTNMYVSIKNNKRECGLYVKENVRGIGTVTYYDPSNNSFGALAHAICENNNEYLQNGHIYTANITSINPSIHNDTGEKIGKIQYENKIGNINVNTTVGIFGTYLHQIDSKKTIETANKNEVKIKDANLYTVIEKTNVESFSINITKINDDRFEFEISDEALLQKCGGIVHGMSGSPIIQDGKLVGAVTHVLVNDPTRGYGIFIENMLDTAG